MCLRQRLLWPFLPLLIMKMWRGIMEYCYYKGNFVAHPASVVTIGPLLDSWQGFKPAAKMSSLVGIDQDKKIQVEV